MTGKKGTGPDLLARLEKWLGRHRRRYLKGLLPGAKTEDLAALEAALGYPLPPDLRTLLAWRNGQGEDFIGAFERSWSLMSCERIAETFAKLTADSANGWQSAWVPFLEDFRDHYLFLDTSHTPAPVRAFWKPDREPATETPSLAAWLKQFVEAVEHGRYAVDPERGDFLRQEDR